MSQTFSGTGFGRRRGVHLHRNIGYTLTGASIIQTYEEYFILKNNTVYCGGQCGFAWHGVVWPCHFP